MPPTVTQSKSELRLGFLELLFGTSKGYLCLATTDPRAPKTSFKQRFFDWPRESIKAENYILSVEVHHNVYFCVNLLSQMERKKSNCLPTDVVWADLDKVNPDELTTLPPPIVIQSSPGRWQAFWRLTSKLDPFDAERYSRRIAYEIDADLSGWDLTQLLRVPLTKNFKYHPPAEIVLERALETRAQPELFEKAVEAPPEEAPLTKLPTPTEIIKKPEEIIAFYSSKLDMPKFLALYTYDHDEDADWSKLLWTLEIMCFSAGMEAEEVFIIAKSASVNKYERDGRPVEHLWREVIKAGETFGNLPPEKELLELPQLVGEPATETFIDKYKDWALEATDATPEFHELSAMILLSSIMSASVRLDTSYGPIAPNLWGMVLGDSTVTRKTTSMKMAIDFLTALEPEMVVATDGSVEGILTAIATRPNKVSLFFRDEISGLFDSINKRDYLSTMPQTFASLYDVPQVFTRILRKETIRIESPAFVFYGGGIRDRVYQHINESWIESGFMPRFLIVSGEFNEEDMRLTGPPTELVTTHRKALTEQLADFYENYAAEVEINVGGVPMTMPPRILAELTTDAWTRYQAIEKELTIKGYGSLIRNVALPTFDRMSKSILKMAVILACARQEPVKNRVTVDEDDVINAAWYGQKWGRHSVELILNAGKAPVEKELDIVYNKIANNPGILRSTLMQHLHLTSKSATELLTTLEDRGMIRHQKQGRGYRFWST